MTTEAMGHSDIQFGLVHARRPAEPWPVGLVDGADEMFAPTSLTEKLDLVVEFACRVFGADGAGILLVGDGGATPTSASGAEARRADVLQVDHHQGPGFHTIKRRQPVVSPELRFDSRWRFWAPQAADLGFRSVLSLVLADADPFGAVTLYSRRPSKFGTASLAPGLGFAQQASSAIIAAVEREQLLRAAESRGIVGQAQGILMERYHINADQAFAVIRRSSSAQDQKLRLVAERIIGSRSLPDLDRLVLHHLNCATRITNGFDHEH
jgi:hypothetical protein